MGSREASLEGERGTWVELAARGARVAAEGVGLMSAAIAGLIPYRPIWGKLFGERFVKAPAWLEMFAGFWRRKAHA